MGYDRRFNEPDNGGQSNIDPTTAAALWKANMEPFYGKAKLIGPAVTNGGGVQWLQQFLGNCTGCHIDAIAMHWYDSATVSILTYLSSLERLANVYLSELVLFHRIFH